MPSTGSVTSPCRPWCSTPATIPSSRSCSAHYLADRIPGATLVGLPGKPPSSSSPTSTGRKRSTRASSSSREHGRLARRRAAFQTVVFTDIVASTRRAASAGDDAWRQVLDRHDRIAWHAADRHGGTIVKSTGDGLLARFDAPTDALRFADDLRSALLDVDLPLRCGLHTGEIELRDNYIAGTAVNLAARVEQAADDGAIWVSSTVLRPPAG